ncbi:hypothetical protein GCM10023310_68690 [Paenibacillus vulneris]|uniref:Core-binding (CB) domain-containing protein n=1 Tax=Paenibacillus vulneris TaxID=1133364 RepID=A0ABW3UIT2_9BACL
MARPKKVTGKISRIYLVFLTENSDKITLSFRSEETLNDFIKERKISENHVVYKGGVRPKTENSGQRSSCVKRTLNTFYEYVKLVYEERLSAEGGVISGT